MVKIDRSKIETAARLLAKAESTDSDHEAIALAERSYSLLAEAINAYDMLVGEGSPGVRRRERRRLWDRRSARRSPGEAAVKAPDEQQSAVVDGYVRLGNGGAKEQRTVDFSL
jgi:hypothetical protein